MILLSYGLRHIHTHFWQVHVFEFQYKCITEKGFLLLYKRPEQNTTSFVSWNIRGNFFLYTSVNQGNLAESFKIAVYLTFSYLIPYKILHVYLPEMSVLKTYLSHPRKARNTPSFTSMYP